MSDIESPTNPNEGLPEEEPRKEIVVIKGYRFIDDGSHGFYLKNEIPFNKPKNFTSSSDKIPVVTVPPIGNVNELITALKAAEQTSDTATISAIRTAMDPNKIEQILKNRLVTEMKTMVQEYIGAKKIVDDQSPSAVKQHATAQTTLDRLTTDGAILARNCVPLVHAVSEKLKEAPRSLAAITQVFLGFTPEIKFLPSTNTQYGAGVHPKGAQAR